MAPKALQRGVAKTKGAELTCSWHCQRGAYPQVDTGVIPAPSHTVVDNDMEMHQRTSSQKNANVNKLWYPDQQRQKMSHRKRGKGTAGSSKTVLSCKMG